MRRTAGLVGGALAVGVVGMSLTAPAQAQVEANGLPFSQLQAQVTRLQADLAEERTQRTTDVAALNSALEAERAARSAADTALSDALNAEETARSAADAALGEQVRELSQRALTTTVRKRPWAVTKQAVSYTSVSCEGGERVTGGGWIPNSGESADLRYLQGSGHDGANGWQVHFNNVSPTTWDGTVYAICAEVD